jgi:hypothetical protein
MGYRQDVSSDVRAAAHLALAKWWRLQDDVGEAHRCIQLSRSAGSMPDEDGADERDALEVDVLNLLARPVDAIEVLRASGLHRRSGSDYGLRLANCLKEEEESVSGSVKRLTAISAIYATSGLAPLRLRDEKAPLTMENLSAHSEPASAVAPCLVSVIVPAYNAGEWIDTAIRSLRDQTWTDIEILVVDDGSQDATSEIARDHALNDSRVRVLEVAHRRGAYAARNYGLSQASGDLITVHDADDWSHPEKIERQALAILRRKSSYASESSWARASTDLRFLPHLRRSQVEICYANMSSLMFRRTVFERLGEWHEVQTGADSEFRRRFIRIYGEKALVSVLPETPLAFGRVHSTSLTQSELVGMRSHFYRNGARRLYLESVRNWHESSDLIEHLPLRNPSGRKGPHVPYLLRTNKSHPEEGRFDVVQFSDFALPGGTTASNVAEMSAQFVAGLKTGIAHSRRYDWQQMSAINSKVWEAVARNEADILSVGYTAECSLLTVRFPPAFEMLMERLPEVRPQNIAVIMNQTPRVLSESKSAPTYDIERVDASLRARFGSSVTWFPIGPAVRDEVETAHSAEISSISWSHHDWVNIIDLASWIRPERRSDNGIIRIGRHSRDIPVKWPEKRTELLWAYPDAKDIEIHVLGGVQTPRETLGELPSRWSHHQFDELSPREFLHGIDVFVYFTHSRWIEAFGRAPLEALAVGVPVITSENFRQLFGDAAIYAHPRDVQDTVRQLMSDPERYERQVRRGHDLVTQRFSPESHIRRISEYLD